MPARSSRPAASYCETESRRCLTILSRTASTWASSSSMRSSTSFCLIAALTRRITPRRSLSPAFMAVFMSSVSWVLRLMAVPSLRAIWKPGSAEMRKAGALGAQPASRDHGAGQAVQPAPAGSIQALALGDVARGATGLALHRGGGLALAFLRGLLVELALAGLGEDAGLLAGALEAAQGKLERLVFADFDARHTVSLFGDRPGHARRAAYDSRTVFRGATSNPPPTAESSPHARPR